MRRAAALLMTAHLFISIHPFAYAQTAPATSMITIQIVDPTDAPIPHARMRIVPYPLELSQKLETNSEGTVRVALSPGQYELFVQANGFQPASQKIDVAVNSPKMLTVALRIGEGSGVEIQTTLRSPDEQQVWESENALWKYVSNLDLENYETLWTQNAVAWRQEGYYIFGQKDVAAWLRNYQAGKLELEDYSLGSIEVRATGNTAIAYYSVKTLWLDDLGRGTPKWARVAHTWVKIDGHWRILGETIF